MRRRWGRVPNVLLGKVMSVTNSCREEFARSLDARIANGLRHDLPVPFYRTVQQTFLRELL